MKLPATLGKYRLEEFIGGAIGEVYRATDIVLHRPVTFQKMPEADQESKGAVERFLARARTASQYSHTNLVRTLDFGEEAGVPFHVREFVNGRLLTEVLQSGELGLMEDRVRLGLELARAIAYLHSRQIVHGEIKPESIHIAAEEGRLRLMDYGISKPGADDSGEARFVSGIPYYMAPEQVRGAPAGESTDLYAFGLVLFEVLSGKRARHGEKASDVMREVAQGVIDYGPLASAEVPEGLAEIVRAATLAKPADRPASMTRIVEQLEEWMASVGVEPPAVEPQATESVAAFAPVAAAPTPAIVAVPAPPSPARAERIRISFARALVIGSVACVLGGLLVGVLGVSIAKARLAHVQEKPATAPPTGVTKHREMVRIPAGNFEFGPDRRVMHLDEFAIGRTEVTNEQYATFRSVEVPSDPKQPVTNVSFDEASDYCAAQGKRLPSEAQWERAARGVNGALYPWGDEPLAARAKVDGGAQLVAADSMRRGASREGVLHLAGNAGEWVDERYRPEAGGIESLSRLLLTPPATRAEPWFIIKGGSFRGSIDEAAAPLRFPAPARYKADDVGFRCASSH